MQTDKPFIKQNQEGREMEWLNYHHLLYFWTVAREGTISRAAEILHIGQPAISTQIRSLETALGHKLFKKSGRGLEMTETGQTVFRYADEIFSIGRELVDTLKGHPTGNRSDSWWESWMCFPS
jgi:LysR family transcriptional regulator, transcriptional activator of nhaA